MNEQFQYMKLNIVTPIDNAPMVVAPSAPSMRPAIKVEAIPINGTVMFDMMLGMAMRSISRFIKLLF
jgi:hypothetical protein